MREALDKPREVADEELRGAYRSAISLASTLGCESIAFSLISSGVFSGDRGLSPILQMAADTIKACDLGSLKEIFLVAFTDHEAELLEEAI